MTVLFDYRQQADACVPRAAERALHTAPSLSAAKRLPAWNDVASTALMAFGVLLTFVWSGAVIWLLLFLLYDL